jgi:hypothetical protein
MEISVRVSNQSDYVGEVLVRAGRAIMALSYNHNDSPRTIGCVPARSSPSYEAALLETVIIRF